MNRRDFLQRSGTLMAGAALGADAIGRSPNALNAAPLQRIGLELYSVRNEMARDFDRTLAAVREIGYTDVELL